MTNKFTTRMSSQAHSDSRHYSVLTHNFHKWSVTIKESLHNSRKSKTKSKIRRTIKIKSSKTPKQRISRKMQKMQSPNKSPQNKRPINPSNNPRNNESQTLLFFYWFKQTNFGQNRNCYFLKIKYKIRKEVDITTKRVLSI